MTRPELLAKLAVEETGMGVYEDKVTKNIMKAKLIWTNLRDKKSVGIIKRNEETGITEIAKPMGVVCRDNTYDKSYCNTHVKCDVCLERRQCDYYNTPSQGIGIKHENR